MNTNQPAHELDTLNRQAQERWEANAEFWDERFGEGNDFQKLLIGPATERLLAVRPGATVLDIACGNGAFSRRLAHLGTQVLAFDFSQRFLERARARTQEHADRIEYKLVDATDEAQLLALGARRFDAAVCIMALMDMAAIEPLLSALGQLLKPGGHFVFSVMHPCFNNTAGCKMVVEEEDREGEIVAVYAVKVSRYIQPSVAQGLGILGQPTPHYYFHRPLSTLFNACFGAGFVLDGLEEPVFERRPERTGPFGWGNYQQIPPVLVARMRLVR